MLDEAEVEMPQSDALFKAWCSSGDYALAVLASRYRGTFHPRVAGGVLRTHLDFATRHRRGILFAWARPIYSRLNRLRRTVPALEALAFSGTSCPAPINLSEGYLSLRDFNAVAIVSA